jgi:tripartite-type tricarboxylate transporter receptor subunit TctC
VLPLVHSAKVRPIAVFSAQRSSALPDTPTMSEAGLPGFALNNWIGLLAPAGTPPAIVAKLNAEVTEIMRAPEMQERLKSEGARFAPTTPEQFAAFLMKERDIWAPIVKASGVSIE